MEKISTICRRYVWYILAAVTFISYGAGKTLGADVIGLLRLQGY